MSYWQGALILSAIAVAFILWPLVSHWWRKDEQKLVQARVAANRRLYEEHVAELEQQLATGDITEAEFQSLKREQQRALLEDASSPQAAVPVRRDGVALLIVAAIVVPVAAWLVYNNLGAKDDWQIHQLVEAWQNSERADEALEAELRTELTRRLRAEPDNTQNWYLLATLAMRVQDFDQAVAAYKAIVEREPDSPRMLAELAQAQFLQAGNQVTPEVRRNTQRALELDPNMPTALGLAGIDAFQQGRFQQAINYWSHAVNLLGEDAPGARALLSGIARAQAEIEARGGEAEVAQPQVPQAAVAEAAESQGPVVNVQVELDDAVDVGPEATVFVYVRAHQGPRMPLAIDKFPASELPREVQLNDSLAMAPGTSMADADQLEVVVRISESGDAVPQSGDWQAVEGPITLGEDETQVAVTVREQIP